MLSLPRVVSPSFLYFVRVCWTLFFWSISSSTSLYMFPIPTFHSQFPLSIVLPPVGISPFCPLDLCLCTNTTHTRHSCQADTRCVWNHKLTSELWPRNPLPIYKGEFSPGIWVNKPYLCYNRTEYGLNLLLSGILAPIWVCPRSKSSPFIIRFQHSPPHALSNCPPVPATPPVCLKPPLAHTHICWVTPSLRIKYPTWKRQFFFWKPDSLVVEFAKRTQQIYFAFSLVQNWIFFKTTLKNTTPQPCLEEWCMRMRWCWPALLNIISRTDWKWR